MLPTDLTVATIVCKHERFLTIEKRVSGVVVVTQPDTHFEADETPEQAAARAVVQDADCEVSISGLLGVYLWIHPQTRQQFLRIVYTGDLIRENVGGASDEHIIGVHWSSLGDIRNQARQLSSPVVQCCIEDFVVGKRAPNDLLAGMMPVQHNVTTVMASARLV